MSPFSNTTGSLYFSWVYMSNSISSLQSIARPANVGNLKRNALVSVEFTCTDAVFTGKIENINIMSALRQKLRGNQCGTAASNQQSSQDFKVAASVPPQEGRMSKFRTILSWALAPALIASGFVVSSRVGDYDPTVSFFRQFLNAKLAANPIANYSPLRNDGSFVYITDHPTQVRAAMSGAWQSLPDHIFQIIGRDLDGKEVRIQYIGMVPYSFDLDHVECGKLIGTTIPSLQMLVRFYVNNQSKPAPETFTFAPRQMMHPGMAKNSTN
jgi:hypothetical protein